MIIRAGASMWFLFRIWKEPQDRMGKWGRFNPNMIWFLICFFFLVLHMVWMNGNGEWWEMVKWNEKLKNVNEQKNIYTTYIVRIPNNLNILYLMPAWVFCQLDLLLLANWIFVYNLKPIWSSMKSAERERGGKKEKTERRSFIKLRSLKFKIVFFCS